MGRIKLKSADLASTIQCLQRQVARLRKSLNVFNDLRSCLNESNIMLNQLIQAWSDSEEKHQKSNIRSLPPLGALRDHKVQKLIINLRRNGHTYDDIVRQLRKKWPNDPKRNPSRSAVHRFCSKAKNGQYADFGITGW